MTSVAKTNPTGFWVKLALQSLLVARGDLMGAVAHLRAQPGAGPAADALHAKAVSPLGTADAAGFAVLAQSLSEYVRPATLIGRMAGIVRVPPNVRLVSQTGATTAYWPGEGAPGGISAAAFSDLLQLAPMCVQADAVVTDELARSADPSAPDLIGRDVQRALVQEMDAAFIAVANTGSSAKPASISASAPTFVSTGATVATIAADALRLLHVLDGANADPAATYWLMTPDAGAYLHSLAATGAAPSFASVSSRGGTWFGLPVLTSNALAEQGSPQTSSIVLVDSSGIAVVDENGGDFDVVSQAALQMDSAPSAGAQALVSLWQNGLQAIRARRYVNWRARRTGAVAVLRACAF